MSTTRHETPFRFGTAEERDELARLMYEGLPVVELTQYDDVLSDGSIIYELTLVTHYEEADNR